MFSIIFDCDGVLFDSNQLKVEAFRHALRAYPDDVVGRFITYHQRNAGISRYVKFRVFLTRYMRQIFRVDEYQGLLQSFGEECTRLYRQASLTPGCVSVLQDWSRTVPLYVASGSDEEELRNLFWERGLSGHFAGIYGSPRTKAECVQQALRGTRDAVMVGDAWADWLAARDSGIGFVFMARYSENRAVLENLADEHQFPVIETLAELNTAVIQRALDSACLLPVRSSPGDYA